MMVPPRHGSTRWAFLHLNRAAETSGWYRVFILRPGLRTRSIIRSFRTVFTTAILAMIYPSGRVSQFYLIVTANVLPVVTYTFHAAPISTPRGPNSQRTKLISLVETLPGSPRRLIPI